MYASLGTLQNSREPLFRCFAEACRGLDVQLVISHGGGLTEREAADCRESRSSSRYAPQVDALARAHLTITHAGLNTVLDSLAHGVPLVAVPITYEQPAIARRVEWTGAGQSIPLSAASDPSGFGRRPGRCWRKRGIGSPREKWPKRSGPLEEPGEQPISWKGP